MKKIFVFLALSISLLVFSSCQLFSDPDIENGLLGGLGNPGNNDNRDGWTSGKTITVEFVIDGVKETKSFGVGEKIEYPTPPEKENYIFSGWYYDEAGEKPAYLGTSLSDKVTLYALYTFNYREALNKVSTDYIKACVGIEVIHQKTSFGVPTDSHKVTGSGVIFEEKDGTYYLLTNCHVTRTVSGYNKRIYSVVDCFGNSRDATLIAQSAEYDLALLSVRKETVALATLSFADSEAEAGDIVIAVGSPGGLDNNITFGNVNEIESQDSSAVGYLAFPVIWHSAPMDHGSSGGVLMNDKFEIIGINYAVGTSASTGDFICGLAVPCAKVLEFVSSNK